MAGKFALIIGNSQYQDPNLTRLKAPEADVNALSALLRDPLIGAFDDVITLADELSAPIRLAIAKFFGQKMPDDLLVLYFSGHGVLDENGELYLATRDTQRDVISGTAIKADFITGEMNRSRSKRQVLILDCCHSGAFARGSKGMVGASVGTASVFQGTGYGRVVLTATDATQFAWEGDQVIGTAENSLFTHYVIEGLQTGEADTDGDGQISVENLYDYVYEQVVRRTPKQTPGKWSYKQQGEIVIAKNPNLATKPAELPRELRDAINSPVAGAREGTVYELGRLLNGPDPRMALAALEALKQLADDDSRRVANAATQILNGYEEAKRLQEQARAEQAEAERLAREKAEAEKIAREKAEQERVAKEKAEQARVAKEQAEADRLAREKAEAERVALLKSEQERIAREKAEQERVAKAKAEAERVAREKAEQERVAKEKAEAERVARWKAEQEQARAEQERIAREKAEQARVAKERAEAERLAREKAEAERVVPPRKAAATGTRRVALVAGILGLSLCGLVCIALSLNVLTPKPPTPAPTVTLVAFIPTATSFRAPTATLAPQISPTVPPTAVPTKVPPVTPSPASTQNAVFYRNRGDDDYRKGDYDSALADYNQALSLDPKDAYAYYGRANTYDVKGDHDRALADYNQSLSLDPNYAKSYDGRGNIYYAKGDYDRALADYNQALTLDPTYAYAFYGRGNVYYTTSNWDRALADYTQALTLDPKFANPYNGRGLAYYAKGDLDRALADYTQALVIDPKYAYPYYNRGNLYRNKGSKAQAIADYETYLRLVPNAPERATVEQWLQELKR